MSNVDKTWFIIKNNNTNTKKTHMQHKKIWKEVKKIPKNIKPKDLLIIPGHIFIRNKDDDK